MTLLQTNALIRQADSLFKRAATAWTIGNNSGDAGVYDDFCKRCENYRNKAEDLLKPLGITVDYPGLFPSFTVDGFSYHSTESAVSAAWADKTLALRKAIEKAKVEIEIGDPVEAENVLEFALAYFKSEKELSV
jgi:hypothetical protein